MAGLPPELSFRGGGSGESEVDAEGRGGRLYIASDDIDDMDVQIHANFLLTRDERR